MVHIGPSGPTTVQEMIEVHKLLCGQAALFRESMKHKEDAHQFGTCWINNRVEDYHIRPTFRAIFIMMDQFYTPVGLVARPKQPKRDVILDLNGISEKQTVLLVRTGDDSQLECPVTFTELQERGLCLPLNRSDITVECGNVVRVSLATAVEFICDLDRREEEADACPEQSRLTLENEQGMKESAESLLNEADEKGIDNVERTWFAVRHVKARLMGVDDIRPQYSPPTYETVGFVIRSYG